MIDPVIKDLELIAVKEFPAEAKSAVTDYLRFYIECGGVVTWDWFSSLSEVTKTCLHEAQQQILSGVQKEGPGSSKEGALDEQIRKICLDKALELVS